MKTTEMTKLASLLDNAKIPYEVVSCWGTPQICYPTSKERICDAVCHKWSYGNEEGLLEIMGLVDEEEVGDTVQGYMTAEQVFVKIATHFINEMV